LTFKESHIGLTDLSEPIGFIVPRKVRSRKPYVELHIGENIVFEHFVLSIIENIPYGKEQFFIDVHNKSGAIVFSAPMRQESALDHGRRSLIEGIIGQPHNFEFTGPDSRFEITPEFSE
jgi:hypothetical protein